MAKKEYSSITEILDELILSGHSINEVTEVIGNPGVHSKMVTERAVRDLYQDL